MTWAVKDFPNSVTSAGLFLAGGAIGHCSEGKKKVVGTELQTSDECHILFPRQVTGRVEQLLKVAAKALSFVQVINEPHACVTTVCRMSPNSHPVVLRSYLWF